ncbi:MAG: flagellin [Myxococcota bacterium]|nr:flagellin [Myxococcota bacterium]
MALVVNTNTASNNAINNLNKNTRSLSNSFRKISSGLRVSKAADDAAGLAVAENLEAASRSADVAMRNTNDGISIISTAEGAASEVGNILKRMRELAVQSSSDTLDDEERTYIQDELTELSEEVDRISAVTEFNGIALADGTNTQLEVQVGVMNSANDRITITLGDLTASTLGVDTGSVDLSTAASARTAIDTIDTAIDSVSSYRSKFGAVENRMNSALNNLETYSENLQAAESRIRDADFAYETAEMSKNQIMQQASTSVLAQAKTVSQGALNLIG